MQSSATRYCLRIETGERQGETMPLHEGTATLGRRSDNTFVLPYGSVSGRHAEIRVASDRVELSDLGSTNGDGEQECHDDDRLGPSDRPVTEGQKAGWRWPLGMGEGIDAVGKEGS